ncbi:PPA1309 family protein [Pseudactinotalea sp. HY160]|uniref:PPA1309 family protein n=1 Tax=Pseudactinotalea sp. HY160 TaxID=2654490 RepID=UPI001D15351A|nr:PPA1309 family protein [Pseudactinotalea sp. HY160]
MTTSPEHPADASTEHAEATDENGRRRALASAVVDLERHAAAAGWDGPVTVCALVNTAAALAQNPGLADEIPPEALTAAGLDGHHLLTIEQDGLPEAANLEELLAQLAWPDSVDGAAVVVERIVVPPEAEADLPADPSQQLETLLAHPGREDVRIAVGVLRSGETWCALRSRAHDADDQVAGSPDAVPGLVAALTATLA